MTTTPNTLTLDALTTDQRFYYDHGAYGWDRATETEDEGRIRCAVQLAEARALADLAGCTFTWHDDWDVDHAREFDYTPEECELVDLLSPDGDTLTSLGCVDDASDEYRRAIEAELAFECRDDIARLLTTAWLAGDLPVAPLALADHYAI